MRMRLIVAACGILACSSAGNLTRAASPTLSDQVAEPSTANSSAARLVAAALEAEGNGQGESRDTLLQQALDADPDYAPAHWHLGDIRVDDRWVKIAEAVQQATAAGTIFEYNNRRIAAGDSGQAQLALAQWCREQGLAEQHRAHALLALAADPSLADARTELNLCQFDGAWLTPSEVADRERRVAASQEDFERWKPRIEKLLRTSKKSSTTRDALRNLNDPTAIPAIEQLLSVKTKSTALLAVDALANIKQQPATESLVRHAVLSKWEEVREAAAKALRDRSIYSYAPLLLAELQAPIEVDYVAVGEGIGSWSYRCYLLREGPLVDNSLETTFHTQRQSNLVGPDRDPASAARISREAAILAGNSQQGLRRAAIAASANARRVQAANAQISFVNSRIGQVLSMATADSEASPEHWSRPSSQLGTPDPAADPEHPRYWWNWWFDYNDIYYEGQQRSVTEYQEYDRQRQQAPPPPPPISQTRSCECFIAGTPVWTPTGPMSIDLARPGDLVLAQHPETGEVAYKPVLANTVRPPVTLLKIRTGDAELVATRGHPLWVSGHGWRMARELKTGDLLHTLSGPRAITSIEPAERAKAYNLVVDEFNSYFAGPDRVLAHDNNLRQPTDVVVPGLAARP